MLAVGLQMGHDAAVAVIDDGKPLNNLERERFSRVKHAGLIDSRFIETALLDAGVDSRDIDFFAITTSQNWPFVFVDKREFSFQFDASQNQFMNVNPKATDLMIDVDKILSKIKKNFEKIYFQQRLEGSDSFEGMGDIQSLSQDIFSPKFNKSWDFRQNFEFYIQMNEWKNISTTDTLINELSIIRSRLDQELVKDIFHVPISVFFKGKKYPGAIVPHHLAHASCSYYSSNYDEADILTIDNAVEVNRYGLTGGLFAIGRGNEICPLGPHFMPHSRYYNVAGTLFGWGSFDGPGKLMGLAPYGEPRQFDPSMIGNIYDREKVYTGPSHKDRLHFLNMFFEKINKLHYKKGGFPFDTYKCDFAASIQYLFEQQSLFAIQNLQKINKRTGSLSRNLCLSGGGALNCPANSLIWREAQYRNVFVPPTSDDGGLALGAAWYLLHTVMRRPRRVQLSDCSSAAYLGHHVLEREVKEAIALERQHLVVTVPMDPPEQAGEDIAADRVIAWFNGRSEVGPRALGNRSILANPSQSHNWKRVNKIKNREEWRPFAPAILEEEAPSWFSGAPLPSPFMLFTATVKRPAEIPAVTHVDGSARLQTVSKKGSPFRRVIESMQRHSGIPVVLNTSLNGPGEPIVNRPIEAINLFLSSELDVLYLLGYRIIKKKSFV